MKLRICERALDSCTPAGPRCARSGPPPSARSRPELRQGGENVLYRPVVHVEHDALQLALTGREEAPRGGAELGVPNLGHPRRGKRVAGSVGDESSAAPTRARWPRARRPGGSGPEAHAHARAGNAPAV